MDVTPQVPRYFVTIAPPPFSPWLRLAHVWTVAPGLAVNDEAPLRRLRDWQLFFQIEGDTWFAVPAAAGHVPLPAGSLALIPPGLVHGWAHRAGRHIAVHCDLHANPQLQPMDMLVPLEQRAAAGPTRPGWGYDLQLGSQLLRMPLVHHLAEAANWQQRLQPLLKLYAERRHYEAQGALQAAGILGQIMGELVAECDQHPADPLLAILANAARRPAAQVSIAGLAAEAGLGETAFRAAVRSLSGMGPRAYLEQLRLERAAYALRLGQDSVTAIAHAAGYDDPFHFSRVFRRVYGISPSHYRTQTLSHGE